MTHMESEKLRRLYDIYEQPMYRIAYAILGDSGAAEDSVSEAFLRLMKHLKRIGEPDSPKTKNYIIKVIRSTSIEQYRRRKHFYTREAPIDGETLQIPDDNVDIEREVFARQPAEILDCLTNDERRLVMLRCGYGLSWRETAERLSVTEAAARKRFERIKKRLISMKGEPDDENFKIT
ncbi:MAG: sigma-70 family RNA polymerase sigma factor [Ruminococcus sp.]|nr:sigma-70 family RNA polymerase sigma factor [Ruminococcus sp.]